MASFLCRVEEHKTMDSHWGPLSGNSCAYGETQNSPEALVAITDLLLVAAPALAA